MDLETIKLENNKLYPYLLCWYDGKITKSYWIKDYNNFDLLLTQVIIDLSIKKYDNYKIYYHIFSKFDGIFILKALSNIKGCIIDPIIHDGKLISIQLTNLTKKKERILHFRDSYLLLLRLNA